MIIRHCSRWHNCPRRASTLLKLALSKAHITNSRFTQWSLPVQTHVLAQVMGVLDAMPSTNLKPEDDEEVLEEDRVYRTTYMFSATMPQVIHPSTPPSPLLCLTQPWPSFSLTLQDVADSAMAVQLRRRLKPTYTAWHCYVSRRAHIWI